jgi:hypothetical protein
MSATIRDYIKRRVRWSFAIAILSWLFIPLTMGASRHGAPAWLPFFGLLGFAGAILALQFFVRCPRCSARIGQTIGMAVGLSFGSARRVNFCPYCGVSLDTPLQEPTNPIS